MSILITLLLKKTSRRPKASSTQDKSESRHYHGPIHFIRRGSILLHFGTHVHNLIGRESVDTVIHCQVNLLSMLPKSTLVVFNYKIKGYIQVSRYFRLFKLI